MRKIKIAEVITRLDWGGSPDIVRIICTHLDPDLYDITLVIGLTKYPNAKTEEFLRNFKERIKIVLIPQLKREINPASDLVTLAKLYFLFRRQGFDIVHTHTAKAGALGRLAAFLCTTPVIIHTLHGHNFYGYFNPLLSKIVVVIERLLALFSDKIIALTELEKKDLIRFRAVPLKKVCLIYHGLELGQPAPSHVQRAQAKEEFAIKAQEQIVGMVGRLEPIKGPGYFIEAAGYLARQFPAVKFILVGEGSLRKKLERQAQGINLKDRFIFTGWREDVRQLLSIMDILVLPSLNEAVGIVLIEAQSLGIPVVATNVGGVPEIVKDNQSGILVAAGDARSLAQAISDLLQDDHKRKAMGDYAIRWVQGKFMAKDMVENISRLYQKSLSDKKSFP